ncbi:hypothetical protein ABK040_010934 [Willaertia magna]
MSNAVADALLFQDDDDENDNENNNNHHQMLLFNNENYNQQQQEEEEEVFNNNNEMYNNNNEEEEEYNNNNLSKLSSIHSMEEEQFYRNINNPQYQYENLQNKEEIYMIEQLTFQLENEKRKTKEQKLQLERYQSENKYLQEQLQHNNLKNESLQKQFENDKNNLLNEIEEYKIKCLKFEEINNQLKNNENLKTNLKLNEIQNKISGIDLTVSNLRNEIKEKDLEIENLKNYLNNYKLQNEELNNSKNEYFKKSQNLQLELDLNLQKLENLQFKLNQYEKKYLEITNMEEELKFLRNECLLNQEEKKKNKQIEFEIKNLKSQLELQEKLKEKIKDLETQISLQKSLQLENENILQEKYETEKLLKLWEINFPNATPTDISIEIKTNLTKIKRLEERIEELIIQKTDLEQSLKRINMERDKFEILLEEFKKLNLNLEEKITQQDVQIFSLNNQINSYKEIIQVYDKEELIMKHHHLNNNKNEKNEKNDKEEEEENKHLMNRINQLENLNNENNKRINNLIKELEDSKINLNQYKTLIDLKEIDLNKLKLQLQEQIKQFEEFQLTIKKLEKERSELENEIIKYEQRLGKGEYCKENVKILHMTINPETEAKMKSNNQLERLKAENKMLNEELMNLKEQLLGNSGINTTNGSSSSSGTTASGTVASASSSSVNVNNLNEKEMLKLKEQNEDFQRRITKLKEVFQKKVNEFRKTVYLLFGFRIDVVDNNRFRLSSMYAEAPEDYLFFEGDGNSSGMKLLSSEFASTIDEKQMNYLTQFKSIPAFLSSLTLDLFTKQTVFQ